MFRFNRSIVILALICAAPLWGNAQADRGDEGEAVIAALKGAVFALPAPKRARAQKVIEDFQSGPSLSNDDFGWEKARPILMSGGVDELIAQASNPNGPLRYAKADALLSAGARLRETDQDGAQRLNQALLDMADRADDFERPIYAHAAAELAMLRCDSDLFERAIGRVSAPESLRYGFWRGRLEGGVDDLIPLIEEQASDEDTRHIRQVIDGYGPIALYGYCLTEFGQ